ncbi:MAG: hypothetical protein K6E37_01540 [Bacteroidales bacterium]|nr:hypothetical protein [Bacteroidales bacterium]
MSSHKVLLFILAVYLLLAGICLVFPEEGLHAGSMSLRFPTLAEMADSFVPGEPEPEGPSPEELLKQRLEAIRQSEQDRFDTYMKESPSRLYFPNDDVTLFDPLFSALEKAGEKHMRILHYGDSQLEEDRITSTIRAGLQEKFGGGGPGLLPFGRPYYTLCVSQSSTASLRRSIVFGEGGKRSDGRYGVMGQCARIDTSVYTTVSAVKSNQSPSRRFRRLTLLAGNVGGSLNVKCGSKQVKLSPVTDPSGVGRIVIDLPDSSTSVRFSTWGSADIYGMQLDDTLGVSVDNIPMRGCSGTIFTRISTAQLKDYAEHDNVRLVILQFGGNAMPYRKGSKSISEYKTSIEKQIRHIHSVMPDAAILFIGPSDMSTSVNGKMQTYPHLPMMVDSLRAAALNSGAAYWDLYQAMGGKDSMVKWVKARPQLAGTDYVHFTPRGAEAMGKMFFESLMLYYDYYRLRRYGISEQQ